MTAKEYVKSVHPNARAERHKTNGGKTYWLIRNGNAFCPMGEGATESKAWVNIKTKLVNDFKKQQSNETTK